MKTAINFIIIFNLIVFFHEMGHFILARKNGVKVLEFALGMGPVLLSRTKGDTQYSLRMLPLGGFCKMEGEDEAAESETSFSVKGPWQRLSIILAGPIMNFILAILLFIGLNYYMGVPSLTVREVILDSPAAKAGIVAGDTLEKINDEPLKSWDDLTKMIRETQGELDITLLHKDKTSSKITLTPTQKDGVRQIGIYHENERNLFNAISYSFKQTGAMFKEFFLFFGRLFRGQVSSADVAGPIGLVKVVDDVTRSGFISVILFTALFSMNLGVLNLLPLPALDGGRLVFILIELLRGKPIDPDKEGMVHLIGFVLLMMLMVFVTFLDIKKWIG